MTSPLETNHHRKKQPELVRAMLLEAAAQIVTEQGTHHLTLDAVARKCSVSKGGLLHHFPNKQALLNGLFDALLQKLDQHIDTQMAKDPHPYGRFTRAYLSMNSIIERSPPSQLLATLTLAMASNLPLRERWLTWFEGRLDKVDASEQDTTSWIIRFAADGLWLSDLTQTPQLNAQQRQAVIQQLIQLSLQPIKAC